RLSNCSFATRTAAGADVETDGCPFEPKTVAELVDEKSLVGEMEFGGDVGEEHEGGRRNAGLRRVQNADVSGAGTRGARCRAPVGHELVQFGCSAPLATRHGDAIDRLEQLRGALAGQRGNVEDGSVLEKFELPPQ